MTGLTDARGGSVLRSVFWRFGVPVAAVVGGYVGGIVVLPWGLVTPLFIVWPLALGFGALLAALGAGWAGTLLSPDGTRTRLTRVVFASVATAAALAFVFALTPIFVPLIYLLAFAVGFVALAASLSAWRLRGAGGRIGLGGGLALILASFVLASTLLGFDGTAVRAVFGPLSVLAGVGGSVSAGVAASVAGVILARRLRGPEDRVARDAAVTLGLVGLPAPVFFGAYYAAALLGLTSG